MKAGLASLAIMLFAGCARAAVFTPAEGEYDYLRLGQLDIAATVERDARDVYGTVELMNTGQDTVRLEYQGYCALAILLYEDRSRKLVPRWDSSTWWAGQQGHCPSGAVSLDIPPETLARIVAPAVKARGILGDSLAAGDYITGMRLRLLQPHDTTVVLPAGLLELDRDDSQGDHKMAAHLSLSHDRQ